MKLARIPYEPGAALDFYEDALTTLGALCARPWHDRLEVVAEGRAARLWKEDGTLHAAELHFTAPGATGVRDAAREVFPGCPLSFRLAEALRPATLALERVVLARDASHRAPDPLVAEKLWRLQFPDTARFRLTTPLIADWHYSLVALARCEVQAIDQHWALHRLALSLPDGALDEGLAREIGFARASHDPVAHPAWPTPDPAGWSKFLQQALAQDLAADLTDIRARQEQRLRHELERIDAYFETYAAELAARASRSSSTRMTDRLAATKAEHVRHRADQIARHEIVVVPHLDALLLVAEPAWRATLHLERAHHHAESPVVRFVPRARRWVRAE
ncbi:MAG: hypothetical protein FJ399_21330 [Verrucomicrobia bacterium]|nr:hypothetical protein [Verrucomicrobiota bacterium]